MANAKYKDTVTFTFAIVTSGLSLQGNRNTPHVQSGRTTKGPLIMSFKPRFVIENMWLFYNCGSQNICFQHRIMAAHELWKGATT